MKKLLSLIALLASSTATALEFTGTVKGFYINKSNTALVTLKKENSSPDCDSTNGWQFQFDSTTEFGKQWVSMLLASRLSGSEIKVGYNSNKNGACLPIYFYYYDY